MSKVIIFPNDNGSVAVIFPILECGLSLDEIAMKDVPAGKPFKMVEASDIPEDKTFSDAWDFDFSNPDGHGIGPDAWFSQQAAKEAK